MEKRITIILIVSLLLFMGAGSSYLYLSVDTIKEGISLPNRIIDDEYLDRFDAFRGFSITSNSEVYELYNKSQQAKLSVFVINLNQTKSESASVMPEVLLKDPYGAMLRYKTNKISPTGYEKMLSFTVGNADPRKAKQLTTKPINDYLRSNLEHKASIGGIFTSEVLDKISITSFKIKEESYYIFFPHTNSPELSCTKQKSSKRWPFKSRQMQAWVITTLDPKFDLKKFLNNAVSC